MSSSDVQLRRVQVSLAEVIDEYVTLEKECDRLRAQCGAALDTSHTLLETSRHVADYTAVMEAVVVAAMPTLRDALPLSGAADLSASERSQAISSSEAVLFVAELASQMQRVEEDVNGILNGIEAARKQLAKVGAKDSVHSTRATRSESSADATADVAESIQLHREARQRATAMTVATLNAELTSWQRRYADLRDRTERERESAQLDAAADIRALRAQLQESDAVLGRMSHELEVLIDENARLKQQLRSV